MDGEHFLYAMKEGKKLYNFAVPEHRLEKDKKGERTQLREAPKKTRGKDSLTKTLPKDLRKGNHTKKEAGRDKS